MTSETDQSDDPFGYVGNLKFDPVVTGSPVMLSQWLKRAEDEYAIYRFAKSINCLSDVELEARLRDQPPSDAMEYIEMMPRLDDWKKRYQDGAKCVGSAVGRLFVVLERIYRQQNEGNTVSQ